MTAHADMNLIAKHINKNIGKIRTIFHEIESDKIHLDVCHIKSSFFKPYQVLVTMGMSALPMNTEKGEETPKYAELLILLPKNWPLSASYFNDERAYWPVRLLKDIARYAHNNNTAVGYAHTISNTIDGERLEPYVENLGFCASVLLFSITLGEEAFVLHHEEPEKNIYFYCVIPIFENELLLLKEQGEEILMDLFEAHKVDDILDIERKSVAGPTNHLS